ncbi:MAG: rhomboid family intramembrane serine protease [Spirochaetia bacterium]|nr:rhomboid family intramembrane serine protease [Spirochaetia bacterium]
MKKSLFLTLSFAGVAWIVKVIEIIYGISFSSYGIHPGKFIGLSGILFAPFLHGDFLHLFSNTAPLVLLGTFMLYLYPSSSKVVLPAVYILGGLGVWIFARPSVHIGASGLIYGLFGFILFSGIIRRDPAPMALSLIAVFLYGGMVWGVLPVQNDVSFESHLSSAVIGAFLAFPMRKKDPPPRSDFDDESEEIYDSEWMNEDR